MKKQYFNIQEIPACLWGKPSERLFIAVHGNLSNKEDTVIQLLAKRALSLGYQVLSFDLPQHGARAEEKTPFITQPCVQDLSAIITYAKQHWNHIRLFACSIGAYFSLLAYRDEALHQSLFLSPIVDMQSLIENMMKQAEVSSEQLQAAGEIKIPNAPSLLWNDYSYVKEHPVAIWNCLTSILYGSEDILCTSVTLSTFARKFNCNLCKMEQGEHYFHTPKQLDFFDSWLKQHVL